jgi:type IV conjugative transfer system protein TraE
MDLKYSIREKDNLKTAIRLLKFFVVVIGIAVMYLTFKVTKTVEYQKTVLVPVFFDAKLEISGDDISDEGAEMYARRITALRANYSPGVARKYFNMLLRLYAPAAYPEAWKAYYDLADRIETANVSSAFYLEKVETDRKNRRIIVEGRNRKFKDNTSLFDTLVQYVISYQVDHGMFQVLDIEEKEKK